jgi:hypothetical protein
MEFSNIFNIPVRRNAQQQFGAQPVGEQAGGGGGDNVGAFISPETFVSFAGASSVIGVIWQTIKTFAQIDKPTSLWIGFAISVVISLLIYWINISTPGSISNRRIGFVLALINALFLFSATKTIIAG